MRRNLLHLMMFQVVIGWAKQTITFSCIGKAREKYHKRKGTQHHNQCHAHKHKGGR
jgi:hypothetical protein